MTPQHARQLIGASGLGICLFLAACSGGSSGDIATVDGNNISRAAFEKRMEASPVAKQVLTQLIQSQLLDEYTSAHNITVSDAEITKKLDELKARYPAGQFDVLLKQQGLTMGDVKKVVHQQIALHKAVSGEIKVSDADVTAYFAKNKEQFNTSEQVHVRHILVDDLATAQKIEAELKAGAKFEVEAKTYSKDPSSKARGGDLGFFGRKQMVPAFEEASFTQPLMVVGPPVKSQFGYHIIEVLERKPAATSTLATAKEQIRQQLTQQQEGEKVPVFLQGLQAKAKITINDSALQNALAPAGAGAPG